ncbi:hypothetical protein AltI4_34900 [Alteromonas sp. I4]|nr:hypothetical protein AltI4_34900 [Alteromonas sp. I4]
MVRVFRGRLANILYVFSFEVYVATNTWALDNNFGGGGSFFKLAMCRLIKKEK